MSDKELPAQGRTANGSADMAAGLAKALAWPVLAAVLVVCFWRPLHTVADTFPQLLSRSEEFSIGGASFHLRKSLVDRASPEIKTVLDDLGPEEVRLILEVKPNDIVCYANPPSDGEKQPYMVLVKLGLFAWVTKEEAKEQVSQGYPCVWGVSTTAMFGRTREFMITAISEVIQQSKALPESKPTTITKTGSASR